MPAKNASPALPEEHLNIYLHHQKRDYAVLMRILSEIEANAPHRVSRLKEYARHLQQTVARLENRHRCILTHIKMVDSRSDETERLWQETEALRLSFVLQSRGLQDRLGHQKTLLKTRIKRSAPSLRRTRKIYSAVSSGSLDISC